MTQPTRNEAEKRATQKNIFHGDPIARAGVVYEYEEITGYIDARGADTKTAFPKLTAVGGYIDASGADTKTAFPKLTAVGGYHRCERQLTQRRRSRN